MTDTSRRRARFDTERDILALAQRIERSLGLFDSINLLNELNFIAFAAGLAEEGHRIAPDGFSQKFRHIRNLMAKRPLHPAAPSRTAATEVLFELIDRLFNLISANWMSWAHQLGREQPDRWSSIEAWFMSRLRDLVELPLGGTVYYRQLVLDRFSRFDESAIKPKLGLTTTQCVALIDSLGSLCVSRIQEWALMDEAAREEFAELHERMGRGELSFRQAVASGRASSAASTVAAAYRGLFVVTPAQIAEHASLPRDSVDAFLTGASVLPGASGPSYTLPTDKSQHSLFLRLADGAFYVIDICSLHQGLFTLAETAVTSAGGKVSERYYDWRGKVTPKNVAGALAGVFGAEAVFENLYYSPTGRAENFAEADILIRCGDAVVLCEVKGHELNRDVSDPVGPDRMARDFKTIQKGYDQCQRTRRYITQRDPEAFSTFYQSDLKTPMLELVGPVREFHYLVVTANSFGSLAGNCGELLKRDTDDPLPVVLSESELSTMLEYIKEPNALLKYLRQRVLLHGFLKTQDELEPAGVFVTQGSLDDLVEKKLSGECDFMVLHPDVSFVFNGPGWERNPETQKALESKRLTTMPIDAEAVRSAMQAATLGNRRRARSPRT